MIDWLKAQRAVRAAAQIGERFKVRPSTVLEDPDDFPMLVDLAAAEWLSAEEEKANAASQRRAGGGAGRRPSSSPRRRR